MQRMFVILLLHLHVNLFGMQWPLKLEIKYVMAVSLYPKEGNPLWEEYSTRVVANTLKTYSNYTFDYPYPKAISVHAKIKEWNIQ